MYRRIQSTDVFTTSKKLGASLRVMLQLRYPHNQYFSLTTTVSVTVTL